MNHKFVLLSLTFCLAVAPAGLYAKAMDAIRPNVIMPSDFTPHGGEQLVYTVGLSGPASQAGSLSISSTTGSNFSSLPTEADYNAGDTSVSFVATVASGASGSLEVSASNSGGGVAVQSTMVPSVSDQF